jgi:hypothetical protein
MLGLGATSRVVHILFLGLVLGSGLAMVLVFIPEAMTTLPSRQLAGDLVLKISTHLDFFFFLSSPLILLSLIFGYFSLAVPLKSRVIASLLMTIIMAVKSQWLQPKMLALSEAMGRAIDDLPLTDPMRIQYLNLDAAAQICTWAYLAFALFLLVQAVVTATPKRKFGIEF